MSTTKRGPGRPKKSAEEKLGARLEVRCSADEKRALEAAAEAAGLSTSDYLRRAGAYCHACRVPLAHLE